MTTPNADDRIRNVPNLILEAGTRSLEQALS